PVETRRLLLQRATPRQPADAGWYAGYRPVDADQRVERPGFAVPRRGRLERPPATVCPGATPRADLDGARERCLEHRRLRLEGGQPRMQLRPGEVLSRELHEDHCGWDSRKRATTAKRLVEGSRGDEALVPPARRDRLRTWPRRLADHRRGDHDQH